MSSRLSLHSLIKAIAPESTPSQKQADTTRKNKLTNQEYLEQRLADVDEINREIANWVQDLQMILNYALGVDNTISFADSQFWEQELPIAVPKQKFNQSKSLLGLLVQFVDWFDWQYINLMPLALDNSLKANYELEQQAYLLKLQQRNEEVNKLKIAYENRDPSAVATYNEIVLERSQYPSLEKFKYLCYTYEEQNLFTQKFKVIYLPDSQQLVIDYQLPTAKIIPTLTQVKYVEDTDEIQGVTIKATEIKAIYQDILAAIALRSIHEVFQADQGHHINLVVFNGFVEKVDPVTKKHLHCYLISVKVTKDSFQTLNLSNIDTLTCLENLAAHFSSEPMEMQPIQPIVDLNMIEPKTLQLRK